MLQQIEEETRIFEEKKQLINSVTIFNSSIISPATSNYKLLSYIL